VPVFIVKAAQPAHDAPLPIGGRGLRRGNGHGDIHALGWPSPCPLGHERLAAVVGGYQRGWTPKAGGRGG